MTTVALDATCSLAREPTGVTVYCSRIVAALARAAPDQRFLLCYRTNRFFRSLMTSRPGPNCSRRLLEEPLSFLIEGPADVFHGLNQRLPRCRLRRAVTTFHDLFVFYADFSTPEFRERFTALARDAVARSDCIIAVSHYTAQRVTEHLELPQHRLVVIPEGVDPVPEFSDRELEEFRRQQKLEFPFLLCVGGVQARKNLRRLVEASERMKGDCRLVLAGVTGYGAEDILKRIQASSVRGKIHLLGYVDDETLAKLYCTATALAFPSLDEGFGLPVLEAMSAGLPVITSNRSALPEVAGDAALLVDPEQTDEIQQALERALCDSKCRQELIEAGRRRAAKFTWEKAAQATLAVYRQVGAA